MSARTKRFWGPDYMPTSTTAFYTVPSGRSALLRFIVFVDDASSGAVSLGLRLNGTSGGTRLLRAYTPPLGGTERQEWYLGLNAGDVLYHQSTVATRIIATYSGFEYIG